MNKGISKILLIIIVLIVVSIVAAILFWLPAPPPPPPAKKYVLSISVSPEGAGNTNPGSGTHIYEEETKVSVSASPASGYTFVHWILDGKIAGNKTSIEVTMDKNHTLIAVFKKVTVVEEVVLRVITRHGYDILDVAKEKFLSSSIAKKYHIKDIKWLSVDPGQWVDIIKASANKPGQEIDVAWGGGPTLFDILIRYNLLSPLNLSEALEAANQIPDELSGAAMKRIRDGKIYWVAAAISSFGFTTNKDVLNKANLPRPTKWIDLANETYAATLPIPSVGVADPTKSTSNTRMYEIILQDYGWEKGWIIITLMGANAKIYDQSGLVRDAAIRGDVAVGITIDFYGYTAQLQNPELCEYIIPTDGSIVNGDPIALLSTSKHAKAAQAFIAWVISVEGQKIWLDKRVNRMPVNPGVFDTPEGKERTDLEAAYNRTLQALVINFSDNLALSYERAMQWFFYATITKAHTDLQSTWEMLAKARLQGKISQQDFNRLINELANPLLFNFTDPSTGKNTVFSQSYAQSINDKLFTDVNYRKQLVNIWQRAASVRYKKVADELKALLGGS